MNDTVFDEIEIHVTKKAGDETCRCSIRASSPSAAIQGLVCQMYNIAKELEIPVQQVLSVTATVLMQELAPDKEETEG